MTKPYISYYCYLSNLVSRLTSPTWTRQNCLITDKTRQFCLVLTQFPISKVSVILNIFETEQLQIGNWVEMRQNSSKLDRDQTKLSCLVCSCVHTTDTDKTRQFCLVHVGSVNRLLGFQFINLSDDVPMEAKSTNNIFKKSTYTQHTHYMTLCLTWCMMYVKLT